MIEKLFTIEDLGAAAEGAVGPAPAVAVAPSAVAATAPVDVPPPPPAGRRRVRKDGVDIEAEAEDEAVAAEEAPTHGEQVPTASAGQAAAAGPAASGAAAAGGQAAVGSVGGFLSAAGLAFNPVVVAGLALGAAGVAVAASGGGSSGSPPVNLSPTAAAESATATEDAAAVGGSVAGNDSDPDGDPLTFSLTAPVPGLTVNPNGSWSFDPSHAAYQDLGVGELRVVTANYAVSDGRGGTATSTLTITVTGTNDAPVAVDDAAAVTEDAGMIYGYVGRNDADPDGDALTYFLDGPVYSLAAPVHGFELDPEGYWGFDASHPAYQSLKQGETRVLVVRYTVTDGAGGTAAADLVITVTGSNDGPRASADVLTVGEEEPVIEGSVAVNDEDVDGDELVYVLDDPVPGLTLAEDGSYRFDPSDPAYDHLNEGDTLEVVAKYTVVDSHGEPSRSTLTITVTGRTDHVNTPPTAMDDIASAIENGDLVVGSVAANDSDVDGDALTYAVRGEGLPGFVMETNGDYTFDPAHPEYADFLEGELFDLVVKYDVTDVHGATTTGTLTISLTGRNDAPAAEPDSEGVAEGSVLRGSVAGNDGDPDAISTLTYALTDEPVAGLTFKSNGGFVFDANDQAYQSLSANETLVLLVPYSVTDEHGASATSRLTITLTGTNDAPTVAAEATTAIEDGVKVVGSVAANDSDIDGDALTYAVEGAAPDGFILRSNGSYEFNPAHPGQQWVGQGQVGHVVVSYRVTDAHGASAVSTLTIALSGLNDGPVAQRFEIEVAEDSPAIGGTLRDAHTDPDTNAILTFALDPDEPAVPGFTLQESGRYDFNLADPAYQSIPVGQSKIYMAFYTVTDEHGAETRSRVIFTIQGTNDLPVVQATSIDATEDAPELVTGSLAGTVTDVDEGATWTFSLKQPVAGLTVDEYGNYSFDPADPAYNWIPNGVVQPVTAAVVVTDDAGGETETTLTINVTGVNTSPAVVGETVEVIEDSGRLDGTVATNDRDPDGGTLTYQAAPDQSVSGLTFGTNGSYTFLPSDPAYSRLRPEDTEIVEFRYLVSDGQGGTSPGTLRIEIKGSNDNPSARVVTVDAVEANPNEADPVTGSLAFPGQDPDLRGGALTFQLLGDAVPGLTLDSSGNYSFDPTDSAYNGLKRNEPKEIEVWYRVTDDLGGSNDGRLVIKLTGTNDAPVGVADAYATTEGVALTVSTTLHGVLGNDRDPDGNSLEATVAVGPQRGTLALQPNGMFTYTPNPGFTGTDSFTYTIDDGSGASAPVTVNLTVNPPNDSGIAFTTDRSGFGMVGYETLVNYVTAGGQTTPSVAALSGGGSVVVWTSPGIDANGNPITDANGNPITVIKAHRLDAQGQRATEFDFPISGSAYAFEPCVVGAAGGGFVVVWRELTATNDWNIKSRSFDAAGSPVGDAVQVHGNSSGTQEKPVVTALHGGGFVVSWTDGNADGANNMGIKARMFGANGEPGDEVNVNETTGGVQNDSTVVATPDGGFIVAWTSRDARARGISFRKFGPDGDAESEVVVTPGISADDSAPTVTVLADGRFVLGWGSFNGSSTTVKFQLFEADGERIDDIVETEAGGEPVITALADGGFVVVWLGTGDGSGSAIRGQRFDANGNPISLDGTPNGPPFTINVTTNGLQGLPTVTATADGGFVVAWEDYSGDADAGAVDTDGSGIRSQVFGPLPPFQMFENGGLNLEGKITVVQPVDADAIITVSLNVAAAQNDNPGRLEIDRGLTGVQVSGNNSSTVRITGTLAEINKLLAGTPESWLIYSNDDDSPRPVVTLTVTVLEGTTTLSRAMQEITIIERGGDSGFAADYDQDDDRARAGFAASGEASSEPEDECASYDDDLIPVASFGSPELIAELVEPAGDWSFALDTAERDPLDALLAAVEFPAGPTLDAPPIQASDFDIPDVFSKLDPLDPALTAYAVIV